MSSGEENNITMPRHIAIIMDGNGRWATRKGLPRTAGHSAGMTSLERIVRCCSDSGVKYLTVYAFSTENWKRSQTEINGIFKIMVLYIKKEIDELDQKNVRMCPVGEWNDIPSAAAKSMQYAADRTADNDGLVFNIALNYGGRREIADAVKSIISEYSAGGKELTPDEITEELISKHMYAPDVPDPDLIIRTGGEKRISNFLLWQCAYSEFVYSDVLWPDFGPDELMDCVKEFNGRHRRFGGLDKK